MGCRPKHSRANHVRTSATLRAQPGTWYLVGTYRATTTASSAARRVRTGWTAYGPAGAFEARTKPVADETAVYARYVGPTTHAPRDGTS